MAPHWYHRQASIEGGYPVQSPSHHLEHFSMPHLHSLVILAMFVGALFGGRLAHTADVERPAIGSAISNLQFKDIRFVPRSLDDLGDKHVYVLVFTNTTCPVAQKYWPRLKQLDAEYRAKGVQFVNLNSTVDDGIVEIAEQAMEFGIEFPFVKDFDGSCARSLGIQRTPEVAVLDRHKVLRYRGRIDDQYRVSGTQPAPRTEELKLAIEALLADQVPAISETTVDGCLLTLKTTTVVERPPTFSRDLLPLLQKHCQECHHDGGTVAPFSLMTFDDARNHGAMLAEVVAEQRMPPWRASRKQHFSNERGMNRAERRTIDAWFRSGMLEGDPQDAPAALEFTASKWEIGKPDLELTAIETHSLPAEGVIDYKYVVMPYVFAEDTWISAAEILPSNPRIVHHCNMAFFTVGQQFSEGNFITGRVPGGTPLVADEGMALKIPKGSVVGLQIHYTTNGKQEKNRMSVGFKFPKRIVHQQIHHLQASTSRIAIPPGASAFPVSTSRTIPDNATGIGMFAHMHLRGKDMTFVAKTPDGSAETLLVIPNYHYGWQQNYRWAPGEKKFPKGTRIEVTAHYDNSAFNPFNPDPTVQVNSGPQTFHEMMFGFFFYTIDDEDLKLEVNPQTGREVPVRNN